jgi:hypothetical protein
MSRPAAFASAMHHNLGVIVDIVSALWEFDSPLAIGGHIIRVMKGERWDDDGQADLWGPPGSCCYARVRGHFD